MKKFIGCGVLMLALASLALFVAPSHGLNPSVIVGNYTPSITSSGNVAAAVATCTVPANATKLVYLEGFDITSSGSTAAAVVTVTVTGSGATQSYTYSSVAGVAAPNAVLSVRFPTPIPTSAVNTAFVISMPSLGAGNTNATIVAYSHVLN